MVSEIKSANDSHTSRELGLARLVPTGSNPVSPGLVVWVPDNSRACEIDKRWYLGLRRSISRMTYSDTKDTIPRR